MIIITTTRTTNAKPCEQKCLWTHIGAPHPEFPTYIHSGDLRSGAASRCPGGAPARPRGQRRRFSLRISGCPLPSPPLPSLSPCGMLRCSRADPSARFHASLSPLRLCRWTDAGPPPPPRLPRSHNLSGTKAKTEAIGQRKSTSAHLVPPSPSLLSPLPSPSPRRLSRRPEKLGRFRSERLSAITCLNS